MLADSTRCHKVFTESLLGNPDGNRNAFPVCGKCTVCRGESSFPAICKLGTRLVFFDVFTGGNNAIQGPHTHENIVNAIKKYPRVQRHLFMVKSNRPASPAKINKIIFMFVAFEIMGMEYHKTDNGSEVTFHLLKVAEQSTQFRLMDDTFWECISLTEPIEIYN